MSKFNDMITDFHESSKKWDPLTHYSLDLAQKSSSNLVGETSHGIGKIFGDTWLGNAGKHWDQMADKDNADFGRWGGNTLKGIGSVLGAMYGYGALGGYGGFGAGGAAGASEGASTGTGSGLGTGSSVPYEYIDSSSYVSGADPFNYGSGVDPNYGTVDFGDQAFDFGKGGMKDGGGQSWWQQLMKQGAGKGGSGGLSGSYGGQQSGGGQGAQGMQGLQEKNLGNPGLYQQLVRLIESDAAKPTNQRQEQPSLLKSQSVLYQTAQNFGLPTDDVTMSKMDGLVAQGYSPETAAMVLKQQSGGY